MSPLAEVLRDEIRRDGPMRFDRYMEAALYHPEFGFYRRHNDPFGRSGDFYTAAQLQPAFRELVTLALHRFAPVEVVDLGAGRGEMGFRSVEYGDELPAALDVVFANEFFDALPVRAIEQRDGAPRELRVNERFEWVAAEAVEERGWIERYWTEREEGGRSEVGERALEWIDRLARARVVVVIDYGFTRPETVRFPWGSLMSYRGHRASCEVLAKPGERDITAHVSFDALIDRAREAGMAVEEFGTLQGFLLRAIEGTRWLEQAAERERAQFKTLAVGMGETFRVLVLRGRNEKGPDESGPVR